MADSKPVVKKESKAQRVERIKRAKDGLDVWDDILRYSQTGWDSIDPEDLERFKWYGIYTQKPKAGHFMVRLRLPGGAIQAHQLEVVAALTDRYAHGFGDITVRQNIQLHWLTIEDIPYVLSQLQNVGITTLQACGDDPRNVVGCPLHGVDPGEIYDARQVLADVDRLYQGNRAFSNLPRKFKVSIGGCSLRCAQPEINDIGLCAIERKRARKTEVGFDISVGGGLSTTPRLARRLPVFLQPWQVRPVCGAIAELFNEYGNRDKRTAARMKFLVDEWGVERFTEELAGRVPFALDRNVPEAPALPRERDHMGIRPQRQAGLFSVGLATRLGRLTGDQMREVAALARECGDGSVRFSNNQNVLLLGVPESKVAEVVKRANNALLPAEADVWQRNFVACTGSQFCNLAITATKLDPGTPSPAEAALSALQTKLAHFQHFVRINYNGCPNACGQHWIADIGLQGVLLRSQDGGEQTEGALLTVAGSLGPDPMFGRNSGVRLALTAVPDALVNLFGAFEAQADSAEADLHNWLKGLDSEQFRTHLGVATSVESGDAS